MVRYHVYATRRGEELAKWKNQDHIVDVKVMRSETIVTLDFDITATFFELEEPNLPYTSLNNISGKVIDINEASHGGFQVHVDISSTAPKAWKEHGLRNDPFGYTSDVYYRSRNTSGVKTNIDLYKVKSYAYPDE
ncbi:hypothetical protein KC906_02905 [Candidatus Kaiserbacteria bacterium]|nr:hypothetical protein [Candidatus Kaiserbacteria bacterium]